MNKKEIIILAAIGAGVYILSQVKAMKTYIAPQYAKTAAQKVVPGVLEETGGRTGMARYIHLKKKAGAMRAAATQAVNAAITRPTSKLFPGAERSRIIPYSESSKHSYYGPKSHKVLNEGYMEKRYKADLKQAEEDEMHALFDMFPEYSYSR